MQSFLQAKKNPKATKPSAKGEPLAEVKSVDQLSGKFKLSTWSRKSAKRRHPLVKEETSEAGSPDSDVGLVSFDELDFSETPVANSQIESAHRHIECLRLIADFCQESPNTEATLPLSALTLFLWCTILPLSLHAGLG